MYKRNLHLICFVLIASALLASTGIAALPEGLVGYWKFDEGSGTLASDSSGVGNDGTLMGGPKWVDGHLGYALELNGGSQLVEIPSSPLAGPIPSVEQRLRSRSRFEGFGFGPPALMYRVSQPFRPSSLLAIEILQVRCTWMR